MNMIKLRNGATVLRADLQADPEGDRGYVVARTSWGEFVTWHVARHHLDDDRWEAYIGNYFGQNQAAAIADYDRRRLDQLELAMPSGELAEGARLAKAALSVTTKEES